jgi:hypothetical protein
MWPRYGVVEMSVKNAIWRDVALHTSRTMRKIVDTFIESNVPKTLLRVFVDETLFSIEIRKKHVFSIDGDDAPRQHFMERLDTYLYSARVVCYSILHTYKDTTPSPRVFMKSLTPFVERMSLDGHIQVEICKSRTFTSMDITRRGGVYMFASTVHEISDAYDETGHINNDALNFILEETLPIVEERVDTRSQRRMMDIIRRIAETVEPFVEMAFKIGNTTRKCCTNLRTTNDFYMIGGYRYVMTQEAHADRRAYVNARERDYHGELLELAWHPRRYRAWCLDEEDRKRTASYFH